MSSAIRSPAADSAFWRRGRHHNLLPPILPSRAVVASKFFSGGHVERPALRDNPGHGYRGPIPDAADISCGGGQYLVPAIRSHFRDRRREPQLQSDQPNYVAMLGGSTFGISSDDPYFFPGQKINQ